MRKEIMGKKDICKKHREPFSLTKRQKFECVSCMLENNRKLEEIKG